MGFSDALWIFFIISAIQPILRQKILEASRLRLLKRIERQRGSRVIALVHRQETMSLLGFPIMRYIDINDSEEVLRAIKLTDRAVPIDLIVHTPGGLVLAADQIAQALRRHPAKVTVFVPHYAMSGGTLIALAADEIVMDDNAVLGPVDPQLGQSPAASVLAVLEKKEAKDIDDQTLILADVARKALAQVRGTVRDLLAERMAPEQADDLAAKLSSGLWTHDYPISAEAAKTLGLPVTTGMPTEVFEFMQLFAQPTRARRPSVEYVPIPYRGPDRPSGPPPA
jgi:ClpP class serine protease